MSDRDQGQARKRRDQTLLLAVAMSGLIVRSAAHVPCSQDRSAANVCWRRELHSPGPCSLLTRALHLSAPLADGWISNSQGSQIGREPGNARRRWPARQQAAAEAAGDRSCARSRCHDPVLAAGMMSCSETTFMSLPWASKRSSASLNGQLGHRT